MLRLLLAATFLLPVAVQADECYFWNAFSDDRVVIDETGTVLVHSVSGGATIACQMVANTFARGPFPAECTNGADKWEGSFAHFPSATGEIGALLLYRDTIWYRRCDQATLQPGFSLEPLPVY
jgi:hypothetical protein